MLEVIDWVNRIARAIGYLVLGAFVGWFLVAAIESWAKARYQRRQAKNARERMEDPWE